MSWIDIGAGSGSSGSGSSNNLLLSGLINSLGNALNNIYSWSSSGFPWQAGDVNSQIVGYYHDPTGYYSVIKKFLAQKNYYSNERLKNAFERIINIQNRLNNLNNEIKAKQNAINSLNNENYQLNQEINKQSQALKQEEEKLNALELEKLKEELKRLKKQSKREIQFNFLTDNPPNLEAQQQHTLNQTRQENGRMNFFLTNPYAILPKGFIYEYHNPGKETYNALNAPNNMDGINNQFRTNALNQVLDNSYQKFLPGNDSYNALGSIEQVKALKFYDLVINHAPQSDKLESALFFKQISQYAKGLRLKILSAPSSKKDSHKIEKLENTLLSQENVLKLKESIKAIENHTETLKNALNQKEQAKNTIQQQKQNLESQRNAKEQQKQNLESQRNAKEQQKQNLESQRNAIQQQKQNLESQRNAKEREKQNQENDKRNQEQERNNLNNEINAIGNERLTLKQLGTPDNFLGILPYYGNGGALYAKAIFSDKNKSIREYYELETKIKNILGFYRIGVSDEQVLQRFLQLSYQQQNELARLLLQ
ncbi:UV radiation resistance protein [Helicobacter pylori]|uniref:UV radiation resistance protein n=1 Tax=Helicobacter pylori TaxID=210 RepID=UPI00112CB584|nr:UV radiation resistance protein [Helicobacter pylori]TPH74577.1 UV radiation resistance protein [Helicobacter pylori]